MDAGAGGGRRVSFLIAGVQKGGTSALFEYLRDVPGLQLPPVKEAHFFDDEDGVDWSAPDYRPYHALFDEDGRQWGEATPIYLYWPHSLDRIRAYNPAMKLILLFRDPIERAWSHWKMEYARGKETEPFAWCIREGRDRQGGTAHRVFSYVERGFYGTQLAAAQRLFPAEQLLLIRSTDLRDDPDGVLANVCGFLGVAPPPAPVARRTVRAAARIDYPSTLASADVALLQRIYRGELDRFVAAGGSALNGLCSRIPRSISRNLAFE